MADIVQFKPDASLPAFLLNSLRKLERDLVMTSKGWKLPDGATLAPETRDVIRAEADKIFASLPPAQKPDALLIIGAMLDVFPGSQNVDHLRAKALVAGYWAAVSDIPLQAIDDAVTAVLRGEDERDNQAFAPTPPQFRKTCLRMKAALVEPGAFLRRMADVIDGDPIFDDAHRARMKANLSDLVSKINQPAAPAQEG